jgi:erythromycin esterase
VVDAPRVWPLDPTSPESVLAGLGAHADLWSGAEVVGVGWTARTVRELHVVAHGLVRLLVERLGFRSVLVEGDRAMSNVLDGFVRTGAGDPRAALAGSRPFLANQELLDLVLSLRHHNDHDGAEPVRVVHGGADDLSSPAALERSLAHQVTEWHERHGDRVVYLGGTSHTAVAPRRTPDSPDSPDSPDEVVPTAGSLLRSHLGARYRSVGLTFGSGAIPQDVPNPPPASLEARLDTVPHGTFLLEPHEPTNHTWLRDTDRVRFVGPAYDPHDDANHAMTGDPRTWFDILVHQKIATSVTFLT